MFQDWGSVATRLHPETSAKRQNIEHPVADLFSGMGLLFYWPLQTPAAESPNRCDRDKTVLFTSPVEDYIKFFHSY